MIIPDYWAEASQRHQQGQKQITIKRFGWSNDSYEDALSMAELRVKQAISELSSGTKVQLSDHRSDYNGAFGVPIREEVVSRHGEEVISRNSYGAQCLSSPRLLIADIDFEPQYPGIKPFALFVALVLIATISAFYLIDTIWLVAIVVFISIYLSFKIFSHYHTYLCSKLPDLVEQSKATIQQFLNLNPKWNIRLYRSPNGLRLLVTHQFFDPQNPEVQQFFSAVAVDPTYAKMCLRQNCFRARLTGKPWRMGIQERIYPRSGIWPMQPEIKSTRQKWIRDYEHTAKSYAACHFLAEMGSGQRNAEVLMVVDLHDRYSKATRKQQLELA